MQSRPGRSRIADPGRCPPSSRPHPGRGRGQTLGSRPGVRCCPEWRFGAGRVVFLAADPAHPPLRGYWDGLTDLWLFYLLAPASATPYLAAIDAASQFGAGGYSFNGRLPLLSNACLQVSQFDVPSFRVHRPVLALVQSSCSCRSTTSVLKRRDRRELAWLSTPAMRFAFSGLAYLVGYGPKGGQAVLAQAGVVEVWAGWRSVQVFGRSGVQATSPERRPGGGTAARSGAGPRGEAGGARLNAAPALTFLGLFAPRKTRYDLAAEEGAVPLMPAELGNGSGRRQLRVVESDGFALKDVSMDIWDMALFRGDTVGRAGRRLPVGPEGGGREAGRPGRQPLAVRPGGGALLTGGVVQRWGTLRRGETGGGHSLEPARRQHGPPARGNDDRPRHQCPATDAPRDRRAADHLEPCQLRRPRLGAARPSHPARLGEPAPGSRPG